MDWWPNLVPHLTHAPCDSAIASPAVLAHGSDQDMTPKNSVYPWQRAPRVWIVSMLGVHGVHGSWVQDAQYIHPKDCWASGRTRATCCYGGSKHQCFDDMERCCSAPIAHLGHLKQIMEKLPPISAYLLQQVLVYTQKGLRSPVAATFLVHESWKHAQIQLDRVRNLTVEGERGELPSMESLQKAFGATLTYFVSLHALHRSMHSMRAMQTSMQAMLRREVRMWAGFTRIYTAAWGQRDFCRCVEAAEYYSRTGAQLLQTGVGSLYFPRVLFNGSLWEHQALSLQNCRVQDERSLEADTLLRIAFSSQCMPGDLASLIGLLHGCILEKELSKVISLHESIFQLATFVQDCLDTQMWGFSVRDAALFYAKLVWNFLKETEEGVLPAEKSFDILLQKRIAWARTSSLFRESLTSAGTGSPWHSQCGPHTLQYIQILPVSPSNSSARGPHGPFCTEYGRFWLYLNHQRIHQRYQPDLADDVSKHRILMVVPITMSWEANPWHHLHWWIPLIYYAKVFLQLDKSEVDVALVFPHGDTDFAVSTAKGRDIDGNFRGHTEPSSWSILQHDFPFDTEKVKMHWSPNGIHAGLLKWISDRPAMSLAKYYGRSYEQVILGLPSLRSFLQTPQLPCTSITQVKRWIHESTATMAAMPMSSDGGILRLAVIQRPETDGRRIQNYHEVLEFVRDKFADTLRVKEVEGLAHGTPWIEQFRQFHDADILLAVHGAGLGWLWALREGSAAVELRSRSSPMWLQCSDLWNTDFTQIFGGLARLAGIHHLCTRPHDMTGSLTGGRLSNVGDMTDADAYNHSDDVYVWLPKAEKILSSAISVVRGAPLPCLDYHWWL
eukprot:s3165_g7.t1